MTQDIRQLHKQAWNLLFDLVKQRNALLRSVAVRANWASNLTPATGMIGEFDYDLAREMLATAEQLTPAIYAAMEELNVIAAQIGAPQIRKQPLNINDI